MHLSLLAQEATDAAAGGIEPRQSDINWILIAGMIQPFVVTLLTKRNVKPGTLRIVNVVLAAMVGAFNAVYEDQQNGGPFDWKRAIVVAVGVWVTSATAYVHLWKGSAPLEKLDDATANFGVGTKDAATPVSNAEVIETVNQVGQVVVDATSTAPALVPAEEPLPEKSTAEITGADRFQWTFTATPMAPPPPPPPS